MGSWPSEHPFLLCSFCSPQVGFLITIASSALLPSFCSQNIATQGPTVCPTSSLGYEGTAFYRAPSFICQQNESSCSLAGPPCWLAKGRGWPSQIEKDCCPCEESTDLSNSPPSSHYCTFSGTKFSLSDPDSLTLLVKFNGSSKLFQANQLMGKQPWRI